MQAVYILYIRTGIQLSLVRPSPAALSLSLSPAHPVCTSFLRVAPAEVFRMAPHIFGRPAALSSNKIVAGNVDVLRFISRGFLGHGEIYPSAVAEGGTGGGD